MEILKSLYILLIYMVCGFCFFSILALSIADYINRKEEWVSGYLGITLLSKSAKYDFRTVCEFRKQENEIDRRLKEKRWLALYSVITTLESINAIIRSERLLNIIICLRDIKSYNRVELNEDIRDLALKIKPIRADLLIRLFKGIEEIRKFQIAENYCRGLITINISLII